MAAPATAIAATGKNTEEPEVWAHALELPCQFSVDLPLPGVRVADVLRLKRQSVIGSHWRVGTDVPLRVNGELIARGEFEVVGDHLAVRLTELA
jgi:flagellar motor switch/type III secretory pathway protein FliN